MRLRNLLGHIKVCEIVDNISVNLEPTMPVADALSLFKRTDFAYRALPVMAGEQPEGLIMLSDIARLAREDQHKTKIGEMMQALTDNNTVHLKDTAVVVITKMLKSRLDLLPVVEEGRLVGVVTKNNLLRYIENGC